MSVDQRRVVVTGLGPVTAVGIGVEELRAGLRTGRSPTAGVTRFDAAPFRSRIAVEVSEFEPTRYMGKQTARRADRFIQFALASTRLALVDAGLAEPWGTEETDGTSDPAAATPGSTSAAELDPFRTAIQLGSAMGGIAHAENQLRAFIERGARVIDPRLATTTFAGAASCQVAIHYGISGPNSTNAMSCAAGAMGIGEAMRLIREGAVDVALAGGVDAPLAPVCYGAFDSLRAMSTRNEDPGAACRPFDEERDGFVMGEGACVLVLEERSRAVARGAHIYAELAGYGTNNDAFHMAAPRADGMMSAAAIGRALTQARLDPSDVGHINAHASSTVLNDRTEGVVIRRALGAAADDVSVSGTKPFHGHALGASGAIEAAITCLAIEDSWAPPTLNLARPGEGCDLPYVTGDGRSGKIDVALSNSFGFGGINAVLLIVAPDVMGSRQT